MEKPGFKKLIKPDVILHVQDALDIDFEMPVGAASESVTVEGGTPLLNTESASVSTVIDNRFVENAAERAQLECPYRSDARRSVGVEPFL